MSYEWQADRRGYLFGFRFTGLIFLWEIVWYGVQISE
jgi:hypothetical protein